MVISRNSKSIKIFRDSYIYLARRFHAKYFTIFFVHNKIIFVNLDKNIRRVSHWNPGGLCDGQSLHGSLDRQSYNNGIDDIFNCFLKYLLCGANFLCHLLDRCRGSSLDFHVRLCILCIFDYSFQSIPDS